MPIKSVCIDSGVVGYAADLIDECGITGKALVVADENTNEVLGEKIIAQLGAQSLVFENGVKADNTNVDIIRKAAKSVDYIVAVGSGTINDLCKYASFLLKKPYVVFGTAPSMNGYGSANASISIAGHKKTLKAHLPQGIFLDLQLLAKAPLRLIRSGFGDSICRPTAQADWLLSHLLLDSYYNEMPFDLLKLSENQLLGSGDALINGDIEAMRTLAETLVLSGFGMCIAGGSYPASQGEHMIAHTMEMIYGNILPHSYHGEQIAVTTLTMAKFQGAALSGLGFRVEGDVFTKSLNLSSDTLKECRAEYKIKQFGPQTLDEINHKIQVNWGDIKSKISAAMLPYDVIYSALKSVGCPLKSEDIGWSAELYEVAIKSARFTRSRFTFLDLKS